MDTDLLAKVAEYTKSFVDAAIPIAKKAYEIGLLTLRIDAAGQFIIALFGVLVTIFFLRLMKGHVTGCEKKAKEANEKCGYHRNDWYDYSGFDSAGYGICLVLSFIPGLLSLIVFLDIWLWTKLLCPELWLAHAAIEKLIK